MYPEHLTVSARLSNRPTVIAAVARACRHVGPGREPSGDELDLSDPFDAEYVSAFSEIFNNIVRHGHAGGSDAEILIEIDVLGDQLVTRIIEHGAPFDRSQIRAPDLSQLPEHGLGIYIVEAWLDTFEYAPGPPNTWTLQKRYVAGDESETT